MNRINKTWDEAQEVIENVKELSQKGEEIREELKAEGRWNKENRDLYQALQQFVADIKKEQAQHIKSAEKEFQEIAQNAEEIRKEIKRRLPKS